MNRSKTPVSSLVVLTAGAIALLLIDTRHAGDPLDIYSLDMSVESNPDGGGTDGANTEAKAKIMLDGTEEAAKKDDIDAGTGQQMQAAAENTGQVGGTEIDASKVNTGNDAGLSSSTTIVGDQPASQVQQV